MTLFDLYNALVGSLACIGFVYILYVEGRVAREYRSFYGTMIAGLILFAVAPLIALLLPIAAHVLHGTAALLVIFSLYDPIHNDLRTVEWSYLLLRDPNEIRHPATWMTALDDEILELYHGTNFALTPAIIAYNTDHSREAVNRHLSQLTDLGLVERVDRGKYELTADAMHYLDGTLHLDTDQTDVTTQDEAAAHNATTQDDVVRPDTS